MKLATWMSMTGIDDVRLASMVDRDRTTISRIRRGLELPSMALALRFMSASGGQVTPNDFAPENTAASA